MPRGTGGIKKRTSLILHPPNPFEQFVYTHTKNHDKKTFIDKKAKTINDNVLRRQPREENASTEGESSQLVASSFTLDDLGVDNTVKTRRPQPRCNTKNDRVPSTSKSSCIKNKEVEAEEHHRNLLLSKNKKHLSSGCNNIKLALRNDKSEVVCAMCYPKKFMVRRLGLFQAYDRESKASHQFRLEVFENCPLWK
uniref:Uncharacterized protein n=1 Tax=Tanacetum cinerariifolium TaxID=118510 RepID=A0A6L2JH44_TANCI|nr:hypothetical protein [Tanacetum cinerariifolium]